MTEIELLAKEVEQKMSGEILPVWRNDFLMFKNAIQPLELKKMLDVLQLIEQARPLSLFDAALVLSERQNLLKSSLILIDRYLSADQTATLNNCQKTFFDQFEVVKTEAEKKQIAGEGDLFEDLCVLQKQSGKFLLALNYEFKPFLGKAGVEYDSKFQIHHKLCIGGTKLPLEEVVCAVKTDAGKNEPVYFNANLLNSPPKEAYIKKYGEFVSYAFSAEIRHNENPKRW